MALTENGGTTMLVQPSGFGGGFGGFDNGWWIILLLLCGWGGMGGFGGFGGGDVYPWLNNSQNINDGFRDQMLQTTISNGFGDILGAINSNEVASLNRSFAEQSANSQGFSSIASQLAQCCCDNRLATCQTQNIVQSEGAATRSAIQSGVQAVLDKMCQDKIDAKNEMIVELNNRINSLEANNYIQNALTAQTQYFLGIYPPPAAAV